ncbi:hypothetical protein ONE63_009912 [Megalurothrips usitatus]|uniref:EGF-like domain-containing protein n=1 Tax=Megalurothrips usitatus TaxID=439358 RepID=A0AAV7XHZ5_9NEOP|nr:hypothetical protein ONE63_009912 [Megalurothrips usitatus]
MRRATGMALVVLVAAACWLHLTAGSRPTCEVGHQRSGCRIHAGLCVCGIGCRSEYQYHDKEECINAIKGQRRNQCGETPCQHGGACSQTTMEPGYKCRCEGTGFYGPRCQYECPSPGALAAGRAYPHECILI